MRRTLFNVLGLLVGCFYACGMLAQQDPSVHGAEQKDGISITEVTYEGAPHFMVRTPSATYYYDRPGGGFSRLIDPEGNDWVQFKREPWDTYPASAASAFRGIPNLVYRSEDGGAGHPGHARCTSRLSGPNQITTTSLSGKWQWTWTFFPEHARLDVQRLDPEHAYWFLYEGTPGGTFEPARQYFGTSEGGPYEEQPDFYAGKKWFGQWNWAYMGHDASEYVLFLLQSPGDTLSDTFSYLGNSEAGLNAEDGMVVFGFGRAEGAQPLMKEANRFWIGLRQGAIHRKRQHRKLKRYLGSLVREDR